jgi:hypothetical protein
MTCQCQPTTDGGPGIRGGHCVRCGGTVTASVCQQCFQEFNDGGAAGRRAAPGTPGSDYCCDDCEEKHDRQLMGDPEVDPGP